MDVLWKAERYELITHIAKLLVPIYEKRHEYKVKNRSFIESIFGACFYPFLYLLSRN